MFIEKKRKKEYSKPSFEQADNSSEVAMSKISMYFVMGVATLILITGWTVYTFFIKKEPVVINPNNNGNASSTEMIGRLPLKWNDDGDGNNLFGTSTDDIRAEYLTFGYFYDKKKDDFKPSAESYNLPINIKIDVTNYYDISRKINLDPYIEDINNNGFAILDNEFPTTAKGFFSAYRVLLEKEIPAVVTSDFLLYYYQNNLKQVFKEIEKTSFFNNVWAINKRMYGIALTRYKQRLLSVGQGNDPILEAMRLEMAYYAVALKLLMPTERQINYESNLLDDSRFEEQEAEDFTFILHPTLEDDVLREVAQIRAGKDENKSPVLLYWRDYGDFNVPKDYINNAKLNNFYLTLKWLNSVFPLYERSETCEDCLLDRDDWVINLAAAGYIAKDMFTNQDLKNQWAVIYKFISFFTGLRSELTYLHYQDALSDLFGEDYRIEDIFSAENESRDEDLGKLQEKIASYKFIDMEGAFNRQDPEKTKYIGMRILQESFWPNNYIFDQVTGEHIEKFTTDRSNFSYSSCRARKKQAIYRCRGVGFDIINLLHSEPGNIISDYFTLNSDYSNYDTSVLELKRQINKFDKYAWNNNVYWATLDLSRRLLEYNKSGWPVYMVGSDWHNQKDINTILGGWVDLHLSADKLVGYYEKKETRLGDFTHENKENYVEPNIDFISEMIAKNDMLIEMMTVLRVTKKTNVASVDLKELNNKLEQMLDIAKKELSGESWERDDVDFVNEFIKQHVVDIRSDKTFKIASKTNKPLTEKIEGIKFVAVVYVSGEKNILAIGPVFNYVER